MLNDGMPVLWITINFFNLWNSLILIFAGILYKLNSTNTFLKAFARITATINSVAVARFFELTCYGIFEYLLAAGSKDGGLFGSISTYFGIVETNSWRLLYLNCLIWLCGVFLYNPIIQTITSGLWLRYLHSWVYWLYH